MVAASVSRARNIKPGFFKNDLLAECQPLARILFAGLWCEADREGRLEDRPKRLKAECLPYDDCDIEALLRELSVRGFIVRYESNGNAFISIANFQKHQNPHVREGASSIPAPDKHSASTVQAPVEHGSSPADSPSLIPLSPSQREIDAHATPAGLAGRAMRSAGCHTLNLTNPVFLAALDEGVTPDEFAAAVNAAKDNSISGSGLFTYAVKAARTNHATTADPVTPRARAGPNGHGKGKVMTLLRTLEGMKSGNRDELDSGRISGGIHEAGNPRLGGPAGG